MNGTPSCNGTASHRLAWAGASFILGLQLLGADWPPAVSTFGRHFHRIAPDARAWARHDVSSDLVNWTNTGVALPPLPAGRVLGACGIEVAIPAPETAPNSAPWHAVLVLVDSNPPSLQRLQSWDGHSYVLQGRPPSLRVPGATTGHLSLAWHGPSQRWVLGVPIRDANGPAISFHGSTNLLDWSPMGRVEGDHGQGGLVELPLRADHATTRWVLLDSRNEARFVAWGDGTLRTEPAMLKGVRGNGAWAFPPVPGIAPPRGRRLVVGLPENGGDWQGGFPWEVALEESGTTWHVVWLPAPESERLRTRSRVLSLPRLTKAGTNQLLPGLPPSCEIRLELPASPHHRLALGLSGTVLRFDGAKREVSLHTNKANLPPGGDTGRWIITRSPSQLELVTSDGQVRLTTSIPTHAGGQPVMMERPGGWWIKPPSFAVHELQPGSNTGLSGGPPAAGRP